MVHDIGEGEDAARDRRLTGIPGDVRAAFVFVGIYGVLGFFPCCLVGSFVGPHAIAAALFHLTVGTISLVVAFGLNQGRAWAPWAGIALCIVLVGVSTFASLNIFQTVDDRAAAVFPLAVGLLFLYG